MKSTYSQKIVNILHRLCCIKLIQLNSILSIKLTAKDEEVFERNCSSKVDQGVLKIELKECDTCEEKITFYLRILEAKLLNLSQIPAYILLSPNLVQTPENLRLRNELKLPQISLFISNDEIQNLDSFFQRYVFLTNKLSGEPLVLAKLLNAED